MTQDGSRVIDARPDEPSQESGTVGVRPAGWAAGLSPADGTDLDAGTAQYQSTDTLWLQAEQGVP